VVVKQFAPGPALALFVRAFEVVEAQEAAPRTLLPDTGFVIGFRYSGSTTLLDGASMRPLPNTVVTGLRTSARQVHTSANDGIVLAKFGAAGAASFFTEPPHHLFGLTCPLGELIDDEDVASTSSRIAGRRVTRSVSRSSSGSVPSATQQ
jgi:hypothetical protein